MLVLLIYLLLCYLYIMYEIITNYNDINRGTNFKVIAGLAIILSPIIVMMMLAIMIKTKINNNLN